MVIRKKIGLFIKMFLYRILDVIMKKVCTLFPDRNKKNRYIEAVTVCVNYSHFLKIAISNKNHFDKWFIVTTREDLKTIKLCKEHNLECIYTEKLHENGDRFNKGKAINDGLKAMERKDWIIHIDADTVLPDNFRDIFLYNKMEKKMIYTCKFRAHCPDERAYHQIKKEMTVTKKNIIHLYPQLNEDIIKNEQQKRNQFCLEQWEIDGLYRDSSIQYDEAIQLKKQWLEVNNRTVIFEKNDFKAGFIQLFHSSQNKYYNETFGSADMSDTDFFLQFHEIRNESALYKGLLTSFKIRNWRYIEVPFGYGRSRQGYMICFHLGDSYKNWNG